MKKTLAALFAAASIAAVTVAAPSPAEAYCRGCAVGAGIIGGLAAGAIIGSAIAGPPAPAYYGPGPAYYGPPPPRCYWTRGQPVWDDYRGVWVRPRVQVCD